MNQHDEFDNDSTLPDADGVLQGDALAIDGLLRELGRGPADPNEVDEFFVQRIVAAIASEKQVKADSKVLAAAKSSSGMRSSVSSSSIRAQKSKTNSRPKKQVRSSQWAFWLPVAVVAACIALVISLNLTKSEPPVPVATLLGYSGACVIKSEGKDIEAFDGASIHDNDTVCVPLNGWATVKYTDGTRVTAQAGSSLTFQAGTSDVSKKVVVNEGKLVADVSKQAPGLAMVILTPELESRVLGTRLIVSVAKKSDNAKAARSRVDVVEGRVRVTQLTDKASVEVAQGQYAMAMPGEKFGLRHTTVELGKGLAAHWNFDEGRGTRFSDASGLGIVGRMYGATWTQGNNGGALSFAGHEYVEVPNNNSLKIAQDISLCAWIKISALNRKQTIAGAQDASSGYALTLNENDQVGFEIRGSSSSASTGKTSNTGTTLKNGFWYHVAGVYSSADKMVRIYINGELDRTINIDSALGPVKGPFSIGAESFGHRGNQFHGQIDDIRVYKRPLNDSEVRKLASSLIH
jgi:hypothetical protein